MQQKFQIILCYLLMACFATLGLKIGFGNIAIITTFSFSIIYAFIFRPKIDWKNNMFWLFSIYFVLNLISAIFSHDWQQGLQRMEVRLMYLLIPFPVLLISTFEISRAKIYKVFVIAMVFLSTILLLNNGYKIWQHGNFTSCFFHDFTALYKQHAVYFSMLLLFAIILLLEHWQQKNRFMQLLSLGILSIAIIFAASKIMMILYAVFLLYYIFIKQHSKMLKISFLTIFIAGLIIAISSGNLRERFVKGMNITQTDFHLENRIFTYDEKKNISDLELRYLLAKVGVYHMFQDQKALFGYGLGDQQDWFDYHLMRYNLAPHWYQGHNVHNQYLDVWLNLGILGLFYFCFMLFILGRRAWQEKDEIWLIFILIFIISFLLEVYLSRNKGIVFFTIWMMFFATFKPLKHEQNKELTRNIHVFI